MKAAPRIPFGIDSDLPRKLNNQPSVDQLSKLGAQAVMLLRQMHQWANRCDDCLVYWRDAAKLFESLQIHMLFASGELSHNIEPLHLAKAVERYQQMAELCAFCCNAINDNVPAWGRALQPKAA